MSRPSPVAFFKQSLKSDAFYADEIINIYLMRPLAAVLVWVLYPTSITPNQVTIIAVLIGFSAAIVYTFGTPIAIGLAGLLATAKDIFDDADGQLARAKQLYSRRGRFLDSLGDVAVDIAIFSAITFVLYYSDSSPTTIILGIAGLFGITLRVSYHVYYQASFLHLEDHYKLNRIIERVTEEDKRGDPVALRLQILFNIVYGWQDRLMYRLDSWCKGKSFSEQHVKSWYADRTGLRISGLLGFGTEFALLTICSLLNALHVYLLLNVFLMNGILLLSVLYRRIILRPGLMR